MSFILGSIKDKIKEAEKWTESKGGSRIEVEGEIQNKDKERKRKEKEKEK